MTILELYAWALEKGVANYEILIQHRDGSGDCGYYDSGIMEVKPVKKLIEVTEWQRVEGR